uniref:Ion transport domain-containing protein n=1 Tax=Knipowitschia caucasica TaxID=637954 RepID=A0AAV2KN55_KNICA
MRCEHVVISVVQQSEVQQSEVQQSVVQQSEVQQSEVQQSVVQQSEVQQSEVQQSDREVQQSEVQQSEVQQSEVQQSEVQQSEVQQSEVQQSEVQQSVVQQSEVQQSEVQQSEVQQSEVQQSEVQQSEILLGLFAPGSILGMHIFGCKFSLKTEAGDTVPDRKNFDSLLWAIVTVFQILTQEDWNMVLYNGMASTSPCAALYFVALMTFGNYVLFNLLVAILVEGFQAEGDANRSYSDDERSSCNFEENEKLKDPLHLSDPKICTLTPNGHLNLPALPPVLFPANKWTYALGSRKNSVISLCNMDQRAMVLTLPDPALTQIWPGSDQDLTRL